MSTPLQFYFLASCVNLLLFIIINKGVLRITKITLTLQTGWPALSMRKKIFFLASSLDAHCWLSKSSDPFPCSKQYFPPHQHGRSALDTSRTLFLLASTQGVSCRLVMNHLIYMYMFSLITPPHPLIYMWVSVCTFMCIYLFSCQSVPTPQLLIFHREYLSWYIVVVYQS